MKLYLRMKMPCWYRENAMGTLESAAVMMVMLPVLTFFAAQVERYQSYSAISSVLERISLDHQIENKEISAAAKQYFGDLITQKVSQITDEIKLIKSVAKSSYCLSLQLVKLGINTETGESDRTFTILASKSSGDPDVSALTPSNSIDRIIAKYHTNGVQILSGKVNTMDFLPGVNKYQRSAIVMIVSFSWKPVGLLSGLTDKGGPLVYTQLIPLRGKVEL